MEQYWQSTKDYMSGFRCQEAFNKLWYGSANDDEADSKRSKAKPLLVQFEATVVKMQELSLWTDPKASVTALLVVHLVYWYLFVTDNSPVYLATWLGIIGFVYITWTQRIWPEIRVPEADPGPDPDWTPVSPDVLSAPELVQLLDTMKIKMAQVKDWLWQLRRDQPGRFCSLAVTSCLILAWLGSTITALGLLYYVTVGYLLLPGALKILVKYPAVHCLLETMEEFQKTSSKGEVTDVKNAKDEPAMIKDEEPPPTMAQSIYNTLQSGISAMTTKPDENLDQTLKQSGDDDLSSYLPTVDETNQSILENAMNSSTRDPMQAHSLLDTDEVITMPLIN